MNIIGYHITDKIACNSDNRICNDKKLFLDFLFEEKGECIKVFYSMDYSVGCLLKALNLPVGCLTALSETGDGTFGSLELQYIPGTWFAIKNTNTKQWAGFSDMAQYFKAELMPESESKGMSLFPIYANTKIVQWYAATAQKRGEEVYNALSEIGLSPKSLTSPIAAFNKEILQYISLPTIDDMPNEAAYFAYKCCGRPWVEAFKRGHFKETWDYDLKSAYASELAELIDMRFGKWIKYDKYLGRGIYGYCLCEIETTSNFSPIIFNNYTPTGNFTTYLTKNEIDFIRKWELGTIEILDGWWWIPNITINDTHKPLKQLAIDLFVEKEKAQDSQESLKANLIKRILSGIWGKTLEATPGGFGANFMPAWGAEVETNVRLKIAEVVLQNNMQNHVLSIIVDGMITDQPFTNLLADGTMGSWKLSSHSSAVIIGSGIQAVENKRQSGQFALNYDWLLKEIAKKPKNKVYKIKGTSAVTLPKAFIQNRFKDLGNIEEFSRIIEVDYEQKRCYETDIKNGYELLLGQYNSAAWDASLITEKKKEKNEV